MTVTVTKNSNNTTITRSDAGNDWTEVFEGFHDVYYRGDKIYVENDYTHAISTFFYSDVTDKLGTSDIGTYVDTIVAAEYFDISSAAGGSQTLSEVLTEGNTAGTDIDLNDNDLLNAGNIFADLYGPNVGDNVSLAPNGAGYISANSSLIKQVVDPVDPQDAATKAYVDLNNSSTEISVTSTSGWADYADGQYTSGSPLAVLADTDTQLPNNRAVIRDAEKPSDITEFVNSSGLITGVEGDSYLLTIEYTIVPTEVGTTYVETWVDIGGAVGELYRRIVSFPKGNGVARKVTFSTGIYTLDTWEANSGTPYIRTNGTANIYDIRFVVYRLHKAGNEFVNSNSMTSDDYAAIIGARNPSASKVFSTEPSIISFTSNRDVASTDIGNTLECTTDATLNLTLGFSAMNVGETINFEAHGTIFSLSAAAGVTINGVDAGTYSLGNGSQYVASLLRKTGTNSYVAF